MAAAPLGGPGLACGKGMVNVVLPDGVLADERTRSRLGGTALEEVVACLWPGDCQTCC